MSESDDEFKLADRLEAIDEDDPGRKRKRGRDRPSLGQALGPFLALVGIGAALYLAAQARPDAEEPMAVAEAEAWQGPGSGFEAMPTRAAPPVAPSAAPPPAAAIEPATPAPTPAATVQPATSLAVLSDRELALLDRLATMEAQIDAMREDPAGSDAAQAQVEALSRQLDALSDETDRLREEADEARRDAREREGEVRGLQAQLEAAEAEVEAVRYLPEDGTAGDAGTGAPIGEDTEAARLAELEARRAAAAAEREARVTSPIIAFGGSAAPAEPEGGGAPDLGQNEAFLREGARAATVEQAVVIANPSRTVVQGTVIQAAMETAIDSSLPGAIRAVVSEDVHSFDGTRVLIPRGSKLIGRYNSQLEPTQRRILIAWDRIIMPDGQSVTISAFGADELGRSGTTGVIDRRLGTRFGSATLVSLISAVPRIAGAAVDDPLGADVAVDLGEDAEDAAGSALEPYLAVPPTITVDQGARITVIVDRDLELY